MKNSFYIAIGLSENGKIWPEHVGSAPLFRIYNRQGEIVTNLRNLFDKSNRSDTFHPDKLAGGLENCQILIVGQICRKWKRQSLEDHNIRVFQENVTNDPDSLVMRYIPAIKTQNQ